MPLAPWPFTSTSTHTDLFVSVSNMMTVCFSSREQQKQSRVIQATVICAAILLMSVFFLLRVWLHGLQLEQKGSTVSRAPKPRSRVYITFSGAAEKRLCDCGSGAVICGWCIVHNPGDFFARWLYCLLRVSGFKRPKFEADLSYITDNVSKCVRKCISKPRSCGFDL